jgi:hypothetical protein
MNSTMNRIWGYHLCLLARSRDIGSLWIYNYLLFYFQEVIWNWGCSQFLKTNVIIPILLSKVRKMVCDGHFQGNLFIPYKNLVFILKWSFPWSLKYNGLTSQKKIQCCGRFRNVILFQNSWGWALKPRSLFWKYVR